jgi:GNAT superfamily N-acetyltransferase
MTPEITLTDAPSPAEREAVLKGLVAFNTTHVGPSGYRPLAVLVKERGAVTGGLVGATLHGWCFIEWLYLPEGLRGAGVGTTLMRRAEDEACRRGCVGVFLDTFDFQARGFYEKLGYAVFGTQNDYPVGHRRFFLQKRLEGRG